MGSAKASLAVGLDISQQTLQNITNEAYEKFVLELKDNGFTVLDGEQANNTEFYKGHKYSTNLSMTPSSTMEGAVTVHPQNVGFFIVKRV